MRLYRFFSDSGWDSFQRFQAVTSYLLLVGFSMLIMSGPGWADIYRYRTSDGRLVITNAPPPAGADVTEVVPEGAGPSTHTTAPTAISPPDTGQQTLKQEQRNRRKARKRKAQARKKRQSAQAVNTHKFGLLPLGGSQAEVRRRIGPPERRVKHGKQKRLVNVNGRYIQRRVRVESWYYPGTGRILPTHLVFYDGHLAEKNKGPR